MLRRLKLSAGVALTSGIVLVLSAFGAVPAAANGGEVWAQQGGSAEEHGGHGDDQHLGCGDVDIWGDTLDSKDGGWVLYNQPPDSSAQVASGKFNYTAATGSQVVATIPESAFEAAGGPHFKIDVEDGHDKTKTFWVDCKAELKTAPNPKTAAIGSTLKDSATLSHGFKPSGTITFTLYDPTNAAADTETVSISGNGTYSTPTGHVADQVGTWHWQAVYSGDSKNGGLTSKACEEPVTVTKASPTIHTTPNPQSGEVGVTLEDTATLGGGYSPGGTITFKLYAPNGETPVFTQTVGVDGNGAYSTTDGFVTNAVGTWSWKATYSGDSNNSPAGTGEDSEQVTIEPVQPHLTTTQEPASAKVGDTLKDSATMTGFNSPSGTITFKLYDPTGETAVDTETVSVDGNGTYSTPAGFVADMPGTWHWTASYSGDEGNKAVATGANDEPVVVAKADPKISTVPNPKTGASGATLKDTATLSGAYQPGGTITFTLYDPSNTAVYTKVVSVDGNGSYSTSDGFVAVASGTWHWKAEYSGDSNNSAVASNTSDEPVTVGASGGVLAGTASTPPIELFALFLIGFGVLSMTTGFAWRRRVS